jgi:predicted nucleotidyltransferase
MNDVTEDTKRLRQAIASNRSALMEVFAEYEVKNPRIFGSVARGDATATSDIDILVDGLRPGLSLMGVVGLELKLKEILGNPVDLVEAHLVKENRRKYIFGGVLLAI